MRQQTSRQTDRKTVYEWEEAVVKGGRRRAMATTRRTLAGWLQAQAHAHTGRQTGSILALVEDDIRKRSRKAAWANRV